MKRFIVNPLQENSYVVSDETGECIVVDAGFYYTEEYTVLGEYLSAQGLKPVALVNTHCHFDHLLGVERLRGELGIPFYCHEGDAFWLSQAPRQAASFGFRMGEVSPADSYLSEGEIFHFGHSTLEVIHIPGHSPGHVTFYSREGGFLLAGDVLFRRSIGRTDLPGGDYDQLIAAIRGKLLTLPEETTVWPGHGPETTIGLEKSENPFLV